MGTSLFSSRKSPSNDFCACARLKKVRGAHVLFTELEAELECFVERSHLSLVESQVLQA